MSAMISLASRTALKRAAVARNPSIAAYAPRFYSSSTHGNDPHVLEEEKHRNLTKNQHKTSTTIENAPGWNEYLASSSEANVKADRSSHTMENLQAKTVQHIKDRHHTNNSPTPNPREQATNTAHMKDGDTVEAVYERDEVSGPLKGATSTKFVHEIERIVSRGTVPPK